LKTALKVLAVLVVIYVGIVVAFESWLGYSQPTSQISLVITTTGSDGSPHPRVVNRIESDGHLYVAVNHWPRTWYYQALENPEVDVTVDGETMPYTVVPVEGAEEEAVNNARPLGLVFRILTGFPPRRIVRLDPR
jgi:hypothetical protein